jgi:hypothetical protein
MRASRLPHVPATRTVETTAPAHLGIAVEQRRGQIIELQLIGIGERHRALDHALQFADVSRPEIREQRVGRRLRQAQRRNSRWRGKYSASLMMSSGRSRTGGFAPARSGDTAQ